MTLKVWGLWQWLCPGHAFLVTQCSSRAHPSEKRYSTSQLDPQKSTETTYMRQTAWHLSNVEFQMVWLKCVVSISKTYQWQANTKQCETVIEWSKSIMLQVVFYLPLLDFPIFQCLIAVLFDYHDKFFQYCPELNFVNLQVNFWTGAGTALVSTIELRTAITRLSQISLIQHDT